MFIYDGQANPLLLNVVHFHTFLHASFCFKFALFAQIGRSLKFLLNFFFFLENCRECLCTIRYIWYQGKRRFLKVSVSPSELPDTQPCLLPCVILSHHCPLICVTSMVVSSWIPDHSLEISVAFVFLPILVATISVCLPVWRGCQVLLAQPYVLWH